jgi:hypothetical protein
MPHLPPTLRKEKKKEPNQIESFNCKKTTDGMDGWILWHLKTTYNIHHTKK